MARPTGIAIASIVEILLGIFALVGGVVHLLFGVGGLVTFSGTDVTLGNLALLVYLSRGGTRRLFGPSGPTN